MAEGSRRAGERGYRGSVTGTVLAHADLRKLLPLLLCSKLLLFNEAGIIMNEQ
ncbi:hypothetical protein [Paenibacillus sp. GXUN7292]|uniref:hypothetical protein n=1 Tax=Paenibacillus sp. GXUN7292 TaxID=3422499 RepID=UPI003D7CB5D0